MSERSEIGLPSTVEGWEIHSSLRGCRGFVSIRACRPSVEVSSESLVATVPYRSGPAVWTAK
eukprot:5318274-Pyramimonas_sp.AAC.1